MKYLKNVLVWLKGLWTPKNKCGGLVPGEYVVSETAQIEMFKGPFPESDQCTVLENEPETFEYPRLYWQSNGSQLQIVYPNGLLEISDSNGEWDGFKYEDSHKALNMMKAVDLSVFGAIPLFLGELK